MPLRLAYSCRTIFCFITSISLEPDNKACGNDRECTSMLVYIYSRSSIFHSNPISRISCLSNKSVRVAKNLRPSKSQFQYDGIISPPFFMKTYLTFVKHTLGKKTAVFDATITAKKLIGQNFRSSGTCGSCQTGIIFY